MQGGWGPGSAFHPYSQIVIWNPFDPGVDRVTTSRFKDFETTDIVEVYQHNNSNCFKVVNSNTQVYRHSYFPWTIKDWNQTDDSSVSALKAKCVKHPALRD